MVTVLLETVMTGCIYDSPKLDSELVEGKNSYLSLTINMPNSGDTNLARGVDGDVNLADGLDSEFGIKNAYLLLFQGASAESAHFCGGFNIWSWDKVGVEDPHISAKYKIDVLLNDFEKSDGTKYFGLIVANTNGFGAMREFFTYIDETGVLQRKEIADAVTYSDFKGYKMKSMAINGGNTSLVDGSKYVLMTNAILFNQNGSASGTPNKQELVDCTSYISSDPPLGDNTVNFYLERVAAKVEVGVEGFSSSGTLSAIKLVTAVDTEVDIPYSIEGWCLANVEATTYLMRQWDAQWNNLYSKKFLTPTSSNYRFVSASEISSGVGLYRGYFCKSSHYGVNEWSKSAFYYQDWTDLDAIKYCNENTFEVRHQMVKNATHVVVKVKFGSGDDLYMREDQYKKLYVSSLAQTGDLRFAGGIAYYILPISHFGDTFTPWKEGEDNVVANNSSNDESANIECSYPTTNRDANYLGRWGVVRNCWYQLKITGISALGLPSNPILSPEIITNDPTPLDAYQTNMKCNLQIKEWIVRHQTEVIQ